MPTIFRIGKYVIYFWSNENCPREFIHVYISEKCPGSNAAKLWITSKREIEMCNNNSNIPEKDLHRILEVIKNNITLIEEVWFGHFCEIKYIR